MGSPPGWRTQRLHPTNLCVSRLQSHRRHPQIGVRRRQKNEGVHHRTPRTVTAPRNVSDTPNRNPEPVTRKTVTPPARRSTQTPADRASNLQVWLTKRSSYVLLYAPTTSPKDSTRRVGQSTSSQLMYLEAPNGHPPPPWPSHPHQRSLGKPCCWESVEPWQSPRKPPSNSNRH